MYANKDDQGTFPDSSHPMNQSIPPLIGLRTFLLHVFYLDLAETANSQHSPRWEPQWSEYPICQNA